MKTEFKREMNRNYMVLHPEKEIGGSYALRMLSENRIAGLLPFQEKRIDGETFLYFNITSRQSLARMMEYRSFKAKEIRQITSDLIVTMTFLEKFLMDGDQLCLEPDMIYVDPDDLNANFCLLPGNDSLFEENFRKLARYILDHVDHTDGEAVILAFALFRAGEKENLGIRDLEKCLRPGETDGKEDNFRENIGKEKLYETERKVGREYRAAGEQLRYQGETKKESEGKPGSSENRKTDLSGETEELAEEKKLKSGKYAVLVLFVILLAAIPAAVYFWGGIDQLLEWKWGILVAEGVLMAGMIVLSMGKNEERKEETEEDWEVEFREEEDRERGGIPDEIEYRGNIAGIRETFGRNESARGKHAEVKENESILEDRIEKERRTVGKWETERSVYMNSDSLEINTRQRESDEMQTALLTGRQIYPATRRLAQENGGEDILVRYFPFIIGKNREISDLCLNLPQISRIHAKIEEDGDGYMITDLNSTNGTSVNGRFLETNESVHIEPGAMLSFADQRYRFL